MKRLAVSILLCLLLINGTVILKAVPKANIGSSPDLSKEQWQKDLQYLAKELPRRHKNAFHTVSREQFERAVAELSAAIPSLQDHEIQVGLMKIVAMVGDAHTELSGFGGTFRRFPLNLYWFGCVCPLGLAHLCSSNLAHPRSALVPPFLAALDCPPEAVTFGPSLDDMRAICDPIQQRFA